MINTLRPHLVITAIAIFIGAASTDTLCAATDTPGHMQECSHHSTAKLPDGNILSNHHFDDLRSSDAWHVKYGRLHSPSLKNNETLFTVGNEAWKDYEFTLQASLIDVGGELIISARSSKKHTYTLILGADQNSSSKLLHTAYHPAKHPRQDRQIDVAPGGIECGRWQRVRIRCQGSRIQVWLNTRMIFDITDDQGPLHGSIRIGSYNARSLFRNLKVKTLNGDLIYDSLPALAKCWQAIGEVQMTRDNQEKRKHNHAIKIVSPPGHKTGIEQRCINLSETQSLCGSIRLKGNVPDGLDIRLYDSKKCISQKHLPPPSSEWQQLSFDLAFDAPVKNGSIRIVTTGQGTLWLDEVTLTKHHTCQTLTGKQLAYNLRKCQNH